MTVATVDGPVDAALTAARETSGLAAGVCAAGRGGGDGVHRRLHRHRRVLERPTRLLDGYKLLGLPETGINVDHTPGPPRPGDLLDLSLRQFVVLPPAPPAP